MLGCLLASPSGQLGMRAGSPLVHVVEVDDDLAGLVVELAADLLVVVVHRRLVGYTLGLEDLGLFQA